MSSVPVLPESAPFSAEQRAWLNGFLAGVFSRGSVDPAAVRSAASRPAAATLKPLTILFGSQTGTAENLAKRAAREAGKQGFAATVCDLAAYTVDRLSQEQAVLLITSTYGEGEPPDNARAFHAALKRAAEAAAGPASLSALRYSVCGLGDTNYVHFCQCAKELDEMLARTGASRAAARVECDLDYEAKFAAWLGGALAALGESAAAGVPAVAPAVVPAAAAEPSRPPAPGTRANPLPAVVAVSRRLNAADSAKQVHHVEFDLTNSGLTYAAGDALGVYAHNCPELVAEVLAALGCDGEEAVPAPDGSTVPLRLALTEHYDLGKPAPELLERVAALAPAPAVLPREPATATSSAAPHHVIDAVQRVLPGALGPVEFVRGLKRLAPRLYSISSSPRAHAGQVHLTIGAVRYEKDGRSRKGVCSTFLADRIEAGVSRAGVFVHANPAFRLPADGATAVIMLGPGTGIAPFRAFLHERRAAGATGRNWLFFGDQHAASDFLYRDELAEFTRDGTLTRLDTAFSRDQAEKVYVQHRMLELAAELYAWLESGAHLYVCGDASRMAKDVDAALHQIVATAGHKTAEEAAAYVDALRSTRRYCRDVY